MSDASYKTSYESPLHYCPESHQEVAGKVGVEISEQTGLGYLNLRGNPHDQTFLGQVAHLLGYSLPLKPSTVNAEGNSVCYWLGPNEWLLITAGSEAAKLEAKLRSKVGGHIAVSNLSGGYTLLTLTGRHAQTIIRHSSPYDINKLIPGRVISTTFAKTTALITCEEDGCYQLIIRRSFADYIHLWLTDASREYGYSFSRQ